MDGKLTDSRSQGNLEASSPIRGHFSDFPEGVVVSIVVPMRNESGHIRSCLDSLVNQTFAHERYEILVVDGRSTDDSRQIVSSYEKRGVHLRLLDNPSQSTPSGMNAGIRAGVGRIIVIAGAHTTYPSDFVGNCVGWLDKTGADVVGGPVETVVDGDGLSARLVAAILSSPFGVGNSKFRTTRVAGFVDTVPFGAFRREIFDRVGLYNERLVRNQDNELSARIRKAGGRIYLTPELTTHYHPVRNFRGLLKYAFRTSQWHIFAVRENMQSMGLRHFAPAMFLMLLLLLALASLVSELARGLLIGTLCIYITVGLFFSIHAKTEESKNIAFALPFATFCFHIAYGGGTLFGIRYLFRQHPKTSLPRSESV